jgi:uncharacterized membrane protein
MTSNLIQNKPGADGILWWLSLLTALVGIIDSLYLTYVKVGSTTPAFCSPGGGCDVVNSSPYSEIFGIPLAVLGAGAYLGLILALIVEKVQISLKGTSLLVQLGISLIGVLYSAYLTYLEIVVIKAICPYCVVSAVALVIYLIVTVIRLVKYQADEDNLV